MTRLNQHQSIQPENDKPVIWGLVLSRKNSTRLPGKTMRPLAGKPMLAYTIEAVQESKKLDECWIFSDDLDALELANQMGIKIPTFERPENVSNNKSTTEETVHYFLSQFAPKDLPDYLMLLQATSPLRTSDDIDGAIQLFQGHSTIKADGLISICSNSKPLSWLYEYHPGTLTVNPIKQETEYWKMPNGAIYILKPQDVLDGKGMLKGHILGYDMPWQRSVDIDTIEDFLYAEALLKHQAQVLETSQLKTSQKVI